MPYSAKHKVQTRQRILESARRQFNNRGFAEVSIGEIMEDAGLTHGGFYRHFKNKSELYAETVRWFLCEEAPKPWQQRGAVWPRKCVAHFLISNKLTAYSRVKQETCKRRIKRSTWPEVTLLRVWEHNLTCCRQPQT